jgi:transposase
MKTPKPSRPSIPPVSTLPALAGAVGIDISKSTFEAAYLPAAQERPRFGSFENTPTGFKKLMAWVERIAKGQAVRFCLEATGHYSLALATFLHEAGHHVSVVNPAWIKQHAGSRGARSKTDRADAWLIADYALRHHPFCWTPPPPAHAQLRALVGRRDQLVGMLTMEKNRQHDGLPTAVQQSLNEMITALSAQIEFIEVQIFECIAADPRLAHSHALLQTIPGFAQLSAAQLLAHLPPLDQFEKARQLCAFAGLSPRQRLSGTSVHGRPCLSKQGSGSLRRCLFMPAMTAIRSFLKPFHLRLQANGKTPKAALGAAMRKLLALAFALLRSGKPFDPLFSKNACAAS